MPPPAETVAVPLLPPLQLTFVWAEMLAVNTGGWVIVTPEVLVHPLLSVTVTVHVPAVKPVLIAVVWAGAGSFHK